MEELSQVATRLYELARFIRERDTGPVELSLAESAKWRDPLEGCAQRFHRLERMAWRLLPPEARDGCSGPRGFVERQTGERFRERVGIDLAAEAFADAIALWLAGRAPADGAASDAQPQGDGDGQDAAPAGGKPHKPPAIGFCVRLSQAAAMVGRRKRTLEGWQARDTDFPLPVVEGGGGKPAEWEWTALRPYLERKSGRSLPEYHPADPNRPDYGDVSRLEEPGD